MVNVIELRQKEKKCSQVCLVIYDGGKKKKAVVDMGSHAYFLIKKYNNKESSLEIQMQTT